MEEWISIKDRVPEKEGRYLVFAPEEKKPKTFSMWSIKEVDISRVVKVNNLIGEDVFIWNDPNVTHWMPLPEPPKNI